MSHVDEFLGETARIAQMLDRPTIEKMVRMLAGLRARRGRLFILGVGGSAANASHAVSDFRKIAGIEAYAPTDNVSELTARVNDEGWETIYATWLRTSHLGLNDMLMIFSVGGGDAERNISANLVHALCRGKEVGAAICGVVGRDGGFTAQVADACIIIPTVNSKTVTPHAEAFQAVIWHLLVSHPDLMSSEMKWESVR